MNVPVLNRGGTTVKRHLIAVARAGGISPRGARAGPGIVDRLGPHASLRFETAGGLADHRAGVDRIVG